MASYGGRVYGRFAHLGYTYEKRGGHVFAYAPDGTKICGARTTSSGYEKPCHAFVMKNGRCSRHGGKSVSGTDSGRHSNGRYVKYIPANMRERYQEALQDEDLLSTRQDIALVDTHVTDKLKKLQHGESAAFWKRLMEAWGQLMEVYSSGDMSSIGITIERINRLIQRAANDQKGWAEVMELLGHRNKLVESERRFLVEMGQMISTEEVMLMLGVIQDIIATHVENPAVLAAIGRDFLRLTSKGDDLVVLGQPRAIPSSTRG